MGGRGRWTRGGSGRTEHNGGAATEATEKDAEFVTQGGTAAILILVGSRENNGDGGRSSGGAVWTRSNTEDVSLSQLHKFWSGLPVAARRELLRIDKQSLFEQVRKNLYCSRCHGLLVEGFSQIILYGKSVQAGVVGYSNGAGNNSKQLSENGYSAAAAGFSDYTRDPSVHPWGGLAPTRDSMLTVLDCFLDGMPLEVFESARARERERELLYPDACGGGGRGWICQNGSFNGRGHGMKETCALHTARLSCEALVDFWSALGDETRRSLLRMKEEDFIERLMFRFDSKRFCRDCRRNVLQEFKEMKELKRSRKEPQCTRWFCAADTVFRYEVSESAVQVDWRDCFAGDMGSVFQRFEWALGTGEGKSDILGFEDVGLSESAHADNLDLTNISACFVTVRGWKRDGRCTELSAKAHALKGQLCVHRRLIVGDGYVSITKGESIQRFFERAEETEEEEDEDAIDKDGNDYEGEGSRPQKHAKSPELARDFLLDAATVIFKEQVEKAFREGTARQNAHSIFVCLALSLLEERVRVACKEITTLEKQNKLLEEEEYEKREEEERRERRKQKEKEKKLRRKKKLKSKEKGNRNNGTPVPINSNGCLTSTILGPEEERESSSGSQIEGTEGNNSEDSMSARPSSPDMIEARPSADGFDSENGGSSQHEAFTLAQDIDDALSLRDGNGAFIVERSKSAKRRTQVRKGPAGADYSSASCRRGSVSSVEASSCPVRRVGSAASSLEEKRGFSPQSHLKNGLHKPEMEVVTKRAESWSRTQSYNHLSYNRHEDTQSCGRGSRSKVGQRVPGRVVGVREINPSSHRDSATKGSPRVVVVDVDPAGSTQEHVQKKVGPSCPSSERRDERINVMERTQTPKPSYLRSSSMEMLPGMSNGYHGSLRGSCNGVTGHHGSENGSALNVMMKPVWTPRASPNTPNASGAASAVKTSGPVGCYTSSESGHGKSDILRNSRASSRPSTTTSTPVLSQASSPRLSSMNTSESSKDDPVTLVPAAREEGQIGQEVDVKIPVLVLPGTTGDGGQGASSTKSGNSLPPAVVLPHCSSSMSFSTPSVELVLQETSEQGAAVSVVEPRISTPGSLKPSEGEGVLHVSRLVPTQGTVSMALPGLESTPQLHHVDNSIPLGNGSSPPPQQHLHSNGHMSMSYAQENPVRPQLKGSIYAFTDMLPLQGHVQQHSMQQVPNILHGGPMSVHHQQQPFGYFQVAPWTARGRNGVLPLPQPGGFLISGPGVSMGVIPPMSMGVPGSLQTAPVGLGVGRLPAIPNGLNSVQFREHQQVFLSRFGGPGGRGGPDNRGLVQLIPGLPPTSLLEAIPTTADANPNALGEHSSLANGALPALNAQKEMGQVDPKISDFSLFHSGWPISGGSSKENENSIQVSKADNSSLETLSKSVLPEKIRCKASGSDEQAAAGVANSTLAPAEYSLFASAPSKGFGFF